MLTRKFYKIDRWDEELYDLPADQCDLHVGLVENLMPAPTRAANQVCDEVRRSFQSSLRRAEGHLLVEYGPTMNFEYVTRLVRPRQKTSREVCIPVCRSSRSQGWNAT